MLKLLEKFKSIRAHSEMLCSPLKTEDHIPQPVYYASPPKWHLAHTSWFFEELVLDGNLPGYQRFHADFAYLFNSYYNNVGERALRANRGNMTRPTVKEVYAYRRYVNKNMEALLANGVPDQLANVILVGLNHEQQHQELLLTDLKYTLGHNPLFPVYGQDGALVNVKNEQSGWLNIPEGIHEIGFDGDGFCYDNELGKHKVYLPQFQISQALVTNGEFLEFIEAGGYSDFNLWLDEGWTWVNENNIISPLYWHRINEEWQHFTLGGLQKINQDSILCHVSFYEAAAFAEWKGMRLPTEFEWEVAAAQLNWGKRWEWTNSAYLPYRGFKKANGALGEYNGKFMVNQMVLRGGSVATSIGHSRTTYRNFFHPHFQWQFSGIRLAEQ